ncbi:MAG: carboxy-S-adenosyl-L-methionine synthase CmoA [Idiomarina sp.]
MSDISQNKRDALFAEPLAQISDFCFDEQVVEVFPDMINRSIPGYQTILHTLSKLTARYAQPNTRLYDLGCSLGAATMAMRKGCEQLAGCEIIGVDNSAAMIKRCRLHLDGFKSSVPVQLQCEPIQQTNIENASVVVVNFTLQFVPKPERLEVLTRIYAGLKPGGVLILSEKVIGAHETGDALLVDLHHDFKRANGYSDLEISQKRAAIENVMRIDSLAEHQQRLTTAGFVNTQVWFQCFNFLSLVAVKPTQRAQS